jgi:uncharacterized DUF497 family protein
MLIDFDPAKSATNMAERKLSFERVVEFDFNSASISVDSRKVYPETRYVAVGFLGKRLCVLCFTPIDGGIRIISFRKANKREIKAYEQTQSID